MASSSTQMASSSTASSSTQRPPERIMAQCNLCAAQGLHWLVHKDSVTGWCGLDPAEAKPVCDECFGRYAPYHLGGMRERLEPMMLQCRQVCASAGCKKLVTWQGNHGSFKKSWFVDAYCCGRCAETRFSLDHQHGPWCEKGPSLPSEQCDEENDVVSSQRASSSIVS